MTTSMAAAVAIMLSICTQIVCSPWWMACSRATMPQCLLMVCYGSAAGIPDSIAVVRLPGTTRHMSVQRTSAHQWKVTQPQGSAQHRVDA